MARGCQAKHDISKALRPTAIVDEANVKYDWNRLPNCDSHLRPCQRDLIPERMAQMENERASLMVSLRVNVMMKRLMMMTMTCSFEVLMMISNDAIRS